MTSLDGGAYELETVDAVRIKFASWHMTDGITDWIVLEIGGTERTIAIGEELLIPLTRRTA